MEFFTADGVIVHTITVDGPGVVEIPGLSETYGPVGCRTRFADGNVVEDPPPSTQVAP